MTAKELIERLQTLPPDMDVLEIDLDEMGLMDVAVKIYPDFRKLVEIMRGVQNLKPFTASDTEHPKEG